MDTMRSYFKENPVTAILLAITIIYFIIIQLWFGNQATTSFAIYQAGGIHGDSLRANPQEIWRLITPIFVHIGWQHLIMNMISLYFVGAMAEQIWGHLKFLVLYLLSGIVGNLFAFFLTPNVVTAGASTSLFGLFAAIAVAGYFGSDRYLKQLGQSYIALLLVNFIFSLLTPGVSLVGHLGGAIGGALCAFILPRKYR